MNTIYLDQSHLSSLAKRRLPEVSQKFQVLCDKGELTPVFSLAHIHETWKYKNPEGRALISQFVDALPRSAWILSRHDLTRAEIRALFFKLHCCDSHQIRPVREKLKYVLYEGMPEPIEIIVEDIGFVEIMNMLTKSPGLQQRFAEWSWVDDLYSRVKFTASLAIKTQGAASVLLALERMYMDSIGEMIPDRFPSGAFVPPNIRAEFRQVAPWRKVEDCPSTFLHFRIQEEIIKDKDANVSSSQYGDLVHAASLPYVDLFLCDKRTHEYLRRVKLPAPMFSKCFSDLNSALGML